MLIRLQLSEKGGFEVRKNLERAIDCEVKFDGLALPPQDQYLFAEEIAKDPKTHTKTYPLVIRMVPAPHQESLGTTNEDEKQLLFSYFTFVPPADKSGLILTKCLFQKLEIGLETWIVKNIFSTKDQLSCSVENLNDDCVICFAEKVDIIALPCRHLSIGIACANVIKKNDKHRECPVCRMSSLR